MVDSSPPDGARGLGLLGGKAAMKERFAGWKLRFLGEPAIMLPAMEERIAARRARRASRRAGHRLQLDLGAAAPARSTWARKFTSEAKDLLATLREKGASSCG